MIDIKQEKVGAAVVRLGQAAAMKAGWIRADKVAVYRNVSIVHSLQF